MDSDSDSASENGAILALLSSDEYINLVVAIVDSTFFGFCLFAFIVALYIHACKRSIVGRPQKILLSLIIFAFLLNTWNYGLNCYAAILLGTKYSFITPSTGDLNDNLEAVIVGLKTGILMATWPFNINLLIGDAIVVWRAWIIGGGHKVFKYIMALLMAANIGANLADAILDDTSTVGGPLALDYVSSFVSLAVNLLGTGIIGFTTWQHKKSTYQASTASRRKKSSIEIILFFLLQSGAVFCAIQLLYAVAQVLPGFTSGSSASDLLLVTVMTAICNGAAVLYPLAVFIMVNTIDTPFVETFYDTKAQPQENHAVRARIANTTSSDGQTFNESAINFSPNPHIGSSVTAASY
ncbi:hypothetical protein BT96DRAFT_1025664 [Gymnopus androsaceus JB14]|uniref:Uncharacterized protein n=1 Tax=Gymnopus androsaceus JB14 TaxID=1447944 RepID=A0A6A4GQ20_9AGAR|nr:hypothetical protein BT96DRAFT_1025664 [Gymnopus androsaceus JB14]